MVITTGTYFILLLVLAIERGFELSLSRRNARRLMNNRAIEGGHGHYPLMVSFHTLFLISCVTEAILHHSSFPGSLRAAALAGAALAQGLRYWAVATLGDRWNTRVIVIPGESPVTSGPYRFLRHPNYLAVTIEILCVPLIQGLWITAILFSVGNAALLIVRIRAEELALGHEYSRAFAAVPRLIPGRRSG